MPEATNRLSAVDSFQLPFIYIQSSRSLLGFYRILSRSKTLMVSYLSESLLGSPQDRKQLVRAFHLSSVEEGQTNNHRLAMSDHSMIYIGTAFVAGVGLALICKDVLSPERRHAIVPHSAKEADALVARPGPPAIVNGIEGCIGNTPLFRIKSLSDATGCEILGKAEVCCSATSCEDRF